MVMGAMVGVFPSIEWSRPIEDAEGNRQGWEARCVVATPQGGIVGAAEAECTKGEANWADRDDYALRSMAQTRAVSKAMRVPLSWVMTLAGFEATPAEEVPSGGFQDRPAPQGQSGERPMQAKFRGECFECGFIIKVGEDCIFDTNRRAVRHPDGMCHSFDQPPDEELAGQEASV